MSDPVRLPDYPALAAMITGSDLSPHNLGVLKNITGGLELALRDPIDFDPRRDFWFPPESRFLNTYLVKHFPRWPKDDGEKLLAEFVVELSTGIQSLRDAGLIDYRDSPDRYDEMGGLEKTMAPVRDWIEQLPKFEQWPHIQVKRNPASSAAQSLGLFLDAIIRDGFQKHEKGVAKRIHWYAAIGANSKQDLERRQRFFLAFKYAMMSHNSYRRAGAQFFGPIVSNTPCMGLLRTLARWRDGATLEEAPLIGLLRDSNEPSNVSHNNIAQELWGFFNLHRQPFYNSQVERYTEPPRVHRRLVCLTQAPTA